MPTTVGARERTAAFLATAAHELRSPLTSVKGFAELLEDGTRDGRFGPREREFVEIIARSTDRLVELVDELLDLARIDADRLELERRPIDLGTAIHEVVELMGPRLAARDQQLGIYVAPTLPPALADAGRVRQVLSNLLTNAHRYTAAGGRIHIGAESDRSWVRIVVADSGIGIEEAELERIFDRFYRTPDSATRIEGTGLGLAIVRSLVELHGGTITVRSRPGAGSTFQVCLPAARTAPAVATATLRGRRFLLGAPDLGAAPAAALADALAAGEIELARAALPAVPGALAAAPQTDGLVLCAPDRDGQPDPAVLALLDAMRGDRALRVTPVVVAGGPATRRALGGEWTVGEHPEPHELETTLADALRAGGSRVLIVAREELAPRLEPALDELGIEYEWTTSGASAARTCEERRFELALVDAGLRDPEAATAALTQRARRLGDAVLQLLDDSSPAAREREADARPAVTLEEAPGALLRALRGERRDLGMHDRA